MTKCPNLNEDGDICGEDISPDENFCEECGWEIDKKIFDPGSRMCNSVKDGKRCTNILVKKFCSKCGSRSTDTTGNRSKTNDKEPIKEKESSKEISPTNKATEGKENIKEEDLENMSLEGGQKDAVEEYPKSESGKENPKLDEQSQVQFKTEQKSDQDRIDQEEQLEEPTNLPRSDSSGSEEAVWCPPSYNTNAEKEKGSENNVQNNIPTPDKDAMHKMHGDGNEVEESTKKEMAKPEAPTQTCLPVRDAETEEKEIDVKKNVPTKDQKESESNNEKVNTSEKVKESKEKTRKEMTREDSGKNNELTVTPYGENVYKEMKESEISDQSKMQKISEKQTETVTNKNDKKEQSTPNQSENKTTWTEDSQNGSLATADQDEQVSMPVSPAKTHRSSRPKKEELSSKIEVNFFAIASNSFWKRDKKKSHVYLKIMDGQKWKYWNTDVIGETDKCPVLKVKFKTERSKCQSLRYQYVVKANSGPEVEEYIYNYNKHDRQNQFRIMGLQNCGNEVNIYDGVLRRKPEKSYFKQFREFMGWQNYEVELKQDALVSAKYFFPKWKNLGVGGKELTCSEMLDEVKMLYNGLKSTYFNACAEWKTNEQKLKKFIGESFLEQIRKSIDEMESEGENLPRALVILIICYLYEIPVTEENKIDLLNNLVLQIDGDKKTTNLQDIYDEFENAITDAEHAIRKTLSSLQRTKDPRWICCLPLFRILTQKVKPFQDISKYANHSNPKPTWWGIDDQSIQAQVNRMKKCYSWDVDPFELYQRLEPMFPVDYMLPRTFVAMLRLEQLQDLLKETETELPSEVILASLYFHFKTNFTAANTMETVHCFTKAAENLRKCCQCSSEMYNSSLTRALLSSLIAADLLQHLKEAPNLQDVVKREIICTFIVAMATFDLLNEKKESTESKPTEHFAIFENKKNIIYNWMFSCSRVSYNDLEGTLNFWDKVLSTDIPESLVKGIFIADMKGFLTDILRHDKVNKENLIKVYCEKSELFHADVQEVLGKIAFQILEGGYFCENQIVSEGGTAMYGRMLSRLFENSWTKENLVENRYGILNFTLSWSPFVHFLEMFYNNKKAVALSPTCQTYFTEAVFLFQETLKELLNGNIRVGDFREIVKADQKVISINRILTIRGSPTDSEDIHRCLEMRQKEVDHIEEIRKDMQTIVKIGELLQVDTKDLQEHLRKISSIEERRISELCILPQGSQSDQDQYIPVIVGEETVQGMLDIIPTFQRLSDNTVFLQILTDEESKEIKDRHSNKTSEFIIKNVWQNAKIKWQRLCDEMEGGDIKFKTFEKYFKDLNTEEVQTVLKMMSDKDVGWIDQRINQYRDLKLMTQCSKAAFLILKIVQEYDLKGDFSPIRSLTEMGQIGEIGLKSIDKSKLEVCKVLHGITEENVECLQAFIESKPLIIWLNENLKEDELKVFVDLATIAAGEGDIEVAKVKCLQSATAGYAPLIFILKKPCDSKLFLEKCKQVWKECETDKALPRKLRDTCNHLEWIENVKSATGSVEVTSMKLAENINQHGFYLIGGLKTLSSKKKMNFEEALRLHVQIEINGKEENREYKFQELQELQSKLMLVAGKAEMQTDEVERFMMILDSAVRLSHVYIKLVAAGCVLFSDWQAKFLCDPNRKVCAFIQFGHGKNCVEFKGRRSDQEDVSTVIPRLANFMERCLESWLNYIDKKRDDYDELNHFTVDQMVILQKELSLIGDKKGPSNIAYSLLSCILEDCSKVDLEEAIEGAKEDVKSLNEGQSVNENIDSSPEKEFIDYLVNLNYDRKLAQAALESGIDPSDFESGILYCVENEMAKAEEEKKDLGFGNATVSIAAMPHLIFSSLQCSNQDSAFTPLIDQLDKVWKEFLTTAASGLKDYLSVEQLGLVLRRLASKNPSQITRTFYNIFKTGDPNLLVCAKDDVFETVLAIYGLQVNNPLPQSEEILLCTKYTTLDEVEIFWRRSLYSNSSKVYCLVNADALRYEVSEKSERRLDYHLKRAKEKDTKFQLVIVISEEKDSHTSLSVALEKYRCPPLPSFGKDKLKKYLADKLTGSSADPNIKPASSVDINNSSVRVVKSYRAGVGKTLYKMRLSEKLRKVQNGFRREMQDVISIPFHERELKVDHIVSKLLDQTLPPKSIEPRLIHIDLSHEVQEGIDYLLFQLFVLGKLTDSFGYVWRKKPFDFYLIETMPDSNGNTQKEHCVLEVLPDIICRSPMESLQKLNGKKADVGENDLIFDQQEFESIVFQRPFQYLIRVDQKKSLSDVNAEKVEGTLQLCLETLLRHCGITDPSWAEIRQFVGFLDTQLQDFEASAFTGEAAADVLPGFSSFVAKFLIQMSRDFSTRSLNISEETSKDKDSLEYNQEQESILAKFQMKRTWESSPHPYLFFNPDHNTMTFLGFQIDKNGNLLDQKTGKVLEAGIVDKNLQDALIRNAVNLNEDFDSLPRDKKLLKLYNVMGVDMNENDVYDPDPTYELTTDNVKKIMAIYMRFRCNIPVIIMGETGCGKTRLVKFLCSLQRPRGVEVQNMILMKVHGGTNHADIISRVKDAEEISRANSEKYTDLFTVLFFDEANTTEAIGLLKEIMCDGSMDGEPFQEAKNTLKLVAACNPYRKHSEELIKALEQAGLGYHVDADKTTDRMGRIPMRRLVYRVQPLPQSMLPLVWDFGQLDAEVEELYIRQMVLRYINEGKFPREVADLPDIFSKILNAAQQFMRNQKNECSFVSLRDVERVLDVTHWFYKQGGEEGLLHLMSDSIEDNEDDGFEEIVEVEEEKDFNDLTKSIILALGVCYHACLKERDTFRTEISKAFGGTCTLSGGPDKILDVIERCQKFFLQKVELGENIAKNQALMENVFMMTVCIELRIPLFLIGKPGSSKSLAKTIVANAMQGRSSHSEFFKQLKEVQMVSFQCSPLSVSEGIVGTFRQCALYQKDKDLDRFASVVVLDEVGLAEDSPKMPLKALHPLLEDGCIGNDVPEPHKKVAFIGISNWALDPAKMNRGILVQRPVPGLEDLKNSAVGICSRKRSILPMILPMLEPLAKTYLRIFDTLRTRREFFGLRDFYSLIKMVYGFAHTNGKQPTWLMLKHAIQRNFDGYLCEENEEDPLTIFSRELQNELPQMTQIEEKLQDDPDCSPTGLIQSCLKGDEFEGDTRYLLLLTENYGALAVLQQKIFSLNKVITIFGSSFPSDQEYTQICRNINRIKVCMEAGSTVILLNLENLYESLYDALNQYYIEFGGERYVDLGLGSHRVKCKVNKTFRLIVVAEKETVYRKFPIPLINRLEKHFLNVLSLLTEKQLRLTQQLEEWVQKFTITYDLDAWRERPTTDWQSGDVFIGYHADTCASIILHVCQSREFDGENLSAEEELQVIVAAKCVLLWTATPDSVLRLEKTKLKNEAENLQDLYFKQQHHESIVDFLKFKLPTNNQKGLCVQVTTQSKLFTTSDISDMCEELSMSTEQIQLLTLQSFETEQQFCRQLKYYVERNESEDRELLLLIQCDNGHENVNLVASAQYCVLDQLGDNSVVHVLFIIHLPRIAGRSFTGFQCGMWHSVHIDDIHKPDKFLPPTLEMKKKSIGQLLLDGKGIDEDDQNTGVLAEETVDVRILVRSCIHSSLAMIRDPENESERTTERVKILLNLLPLAETKGRCTFVSGLAIHLAKLMKEKEEESMLHSGVSNWLTKDATEKRLIMKNGTFRKAISDCLAEKISTPLAGVIAQIDSDRNLNIVGVDEKKNTWAQKIWLQVINNCEATQIKYDILISPKDRKPLREILVKGHGIEGRAFESKFPFSWLLFELIAKVIFSTADNEKGILDIARMVESQPLGKIVTSCLTSEQSQEPMRFYLDDFISMVYPAESEDERMVLSENIWTQSSRELKEVSKTAMSRFIAFHIVYTKSIQRIRNYSHITSVWPDCSQNVIEFLRSPEASSITSDTEMTMDIIGLSLVLKRLEEVKNSFGEYNKRLQWLQLLNTYRPVVERLLGFFTSLDGIHDENCRESIKESRHRWTRIIVMKLLLENVYSGQECDVKLCLSLFMLLKKEADLKNIKSFETVENFLRRSIKGAATAAFGDQQKCKVCENGIVGQPIQLQCSNVICIDCRNIHVAADLEECPACHGTHQIDDMDDHDSESEKTQKYNTFKNNCNNFFMEIVSQLCFANNEAPSREVIRKLISFVTVETKMDHGLKTVSKEMALVESKVDSTPVFRSFLLQHLLRTSLDDVMEFLAEYLSRAEAMLKEDPEKVIEFSILVIQCLEDSILQKASSSKEKEPWKAEMIKATKYLKDSADVINDENLDVKKLCCVAETRFSLACAAKFLFQHNVEKTLKYLKNLKKLYEAVSTMTSKCRWTKLFFIKYFCRSFGVKSYRQILSSGTELKQTLPVELLSLPELKAENVQECLDRFIVCGKQYKELRDKITQSLVDEKIELDLQGLTIPETHKKVFVFLAVFREVTMMHVYEVEKRRFKAEAIQKLLDVLEDSSCLQNEKTVVTKLADNTLWTKESAMCIKEGTTVADQDIVSLLYHVFFSITKGSCEGTLLEPFITIIENTDTLQKCYLPAMDAVDLDEIRAALANTQDYGKLPIYKCPNGHVYLIGNCGNPIVAKTTCSECGAKIGGKAQHVLEDGNVKIDMQEFDEQYTGHISGRAESREDVPTAQRELSSVNCSILRFLLHSSLYIAASQTPEAVNAIIKPRIEVTAVFPFIMDHIKKDLTIIQKATGSSEDDVYLLLHRICTNFTEKHESKSQHLQSCLSALKNKKDRSCWEKEFADEFFSPVLKDLESELKTLGKELVEDKRLGADPLLSLLYETETANEDISVHELQNHPAVWRYRSQISMDHLSKTFMMQIPANEHAVLRAFLEEEHNVRVIRFIPSILKLQKVLIHKFARKLDRSEASDLSMQYVIDSYKVNKATEEDNEGMGETESKWMEIDQLVSDFIEAWRCIRGQLGKFRFQTLEGNRQVSEKYYAKDLEKEDPVSLFLPTSREQGLCSYGLLYFLLKKQNSFLEEYCRKKDIEFGKLPKVKVREITHAHLISYHPDRDLLPLVMANCQYTFEVGKGTKVEYNFANLERQLSDRFLFSKSVIDLHPKEFDLMTYRSESTNANVFRELRKKIKQVPLNSTVAKQISSEFRRYQDICDALDKLDIVIRFLQSVGGQGNTMLGEFMRQSLKMETTFLSQNMRKICQCKHVQSLWIILAITKTKNQASYKKDVFEGVSDTYRQELTSAQKDIVNTVCEELSVERLNTMVEVLYECIVLTIDSGSENDIEDGDGIPMANYSIRDTLMVYVEDPAYDVDDTFLPDWINETLMKFPGDKEEPDCIFTSQSMDLWICLYENYSKRKN